VPKHAKRHTNIIDPKNIQKNVWELSFENRLFSPIIRPISQPKRYKAVSETHRIR
jgi:hypothetical protein